MSGLKFVVLGHCEFLEENLTVRQQLQDTFTTEI